MPRTSWRLERSATGLLVVDIQERLLPAIFEKERVVANARRLIAGAQVLGVPVWVTEQYRQGLGPTVPEIAQAIPDFAPREKLTFSAAGLPALLAAFHERGVVDVVICGIEAHVCVCQTALDLAEAGFRPYAVGDAVSSRTPANWEFGLARLRQGGVAVGSTEMVLFEWLERAGTSEFKQILGLVR